jgi:hypothetical protein
MKIRLRGILTEIGSNYVTHDIAHSGAIIQCDGQNLHFDLPPETVAKLGFHLFDVVDITLEFTPRVERMRKAAKPKGKKR